MPESIVHTILGNNHKATPCNTKILQILFTVASCPLPLFAAHRTFIDEQNYYTVIKQIKPRLKYSLLFKCMLQSPPPHIKIN